MIRVLRTSWHKARLAHECSNCGHSIRPGERYRIDIVLGYDWDGIMRWKECAKCAEEND